MLRISKNGKELAVTKGAFKEYFETQGWRIIQNINNRGTGALAAPKTPFYETNDDLPINIEKDEIEAPEDLDGWDDFEEEDEEVEKPISEMNKSELIAKAKSMGLNISGNPKTSVLRSMIREAM